MKKALIELVLDTLEGQSFFEWYEGDFKDYVQGESGHKTKEQIKEDIAHLFHLN